MNYDTRDRLANVVIAFFILTLFLFGMALGNYKPISKEIKTKNAITPDTIIINSNGLKDTTYIYKFK